MGGAKGGDVEVTKEELQLCGGGGGGDETVRERAGVPGHQVRRVAEWSSCIRSPLSRVSGAPPPRGCAVYCGFDPTAPSLHLGHLLTVSTLLHCRQSGLHPIAVVCVCVCCYVCILVYGLCVISAGGRGNREGGGPEWACPGEGGA